jgi:hypothetical protein
MSENFDFNIDNYSTDNLISFFRLHNNYSLQDLDKTAKEMTLNVVSSNYSSKYKYELIEFIHQAQELLIKVKNDDNDIIIKKNIKQTDKKDENNTPIDNVGKIINPLSAHPTLQRQKMPSDSINSYRNHMITSNYIFNTIFRDDFFNTQPNNCSFTLPFTIKNVTGISLSGIQIPNVISTFSDVKGTNQLFIHEDVTNIETIIMIPVGDYEPEDFIIALEKAINTQLLGSWPNRFIVKIDTPTQRITIANTTYSFTMNIIKKDIINIGTCLYEANRNTNSDLIHNKKKIRPTDLVNTMGYLIGYRQIEYSGLKSYQAECVYTDTLQNYYYFELNDYTGYQFASTIGVLPTCFLSNNIIAVLPITTPKFVASFDNNSNFIYKSRQYASPINLKKISIKMLGTEGQLVELNQNDFAFVLEINTLYDNIMPFERGDASLA